MTASVWLLVLQGRLLRGSPNLISTVVQEVKQDLMDAFRAEVLIRVVVAVEPKPSSRWPSPKQRHKQFAGL